MSSNDEQIKLKRYYFNLRSLGEVICFLLMHSRIGWENCVVSIEEWISGRFDKSYLPVGRSGEKKLPVLAITAGTTTDLMPESHDIAKWIAGRCEYSLFGSTPEKQSKAEQIFDYCSTIWNEVDPVLNIFSKAEVSKR
jgi:hypothetical protein